MTLKMQKVPNLNRERLLANKRIMSTKNKTSTYRNQNYTNTKKTYGSK